MDNSFKLYDERRGVFKSVVFLFSISNCSRLAMHRAGPKEKTRAARTYVKTFVCVFVNRKFTRTSYNLIYEIYDIPRVEKLFKFISTERKMTIICKTYLLLD